MRSPVAQSGFTLLEMLVVVAITLLIIGVTVPMVGRINDARQIDRAAELLLDELNAARGQALASNQPVEVCFAFTGTPEAYRRVRSRKLEQDGSYQWTGRVRSLGENVVFAPTFSSLISSQVRSVLASPPDAVEGVAVRFYPSGRVERTDPAATPLPPDETALTVSVVLERQVGDGTALPSLFATLQIHPRTGRVTLYQP